MERGGTPGADSTYTFVSVLLSDKLKVDIESERKNLKIKEFSGLVLNEAMVIHN